VSIYENYARAAARVAEAMLRKLGKRISDHQHAQKRIADLMIDLFVGLCVLSRRADSIIGSDPASTAQVVDIAKDLHPSGPPPHGSQRARCDPQRRPRSRALAGAVLERGRYPWDVL